MNHSSGSAHRELLRQLPKAELHCHLDGSLRPATMLELSAEHGVKLPRDDARALGEYMLVSDARSLDDYLKRFEITLSVMQWAPALERIAFELAQDAHADGVWYLEVRFAPVLNTRAGLQPQDAVSAALRGLRRAEQELGVVSRVIVTALRNQPPDVSLEMARLAVSFSGQGVAGFDLAGPELHFPAAAHARAFEFARTHGMACTCHAGEGAGAESVRQAVHDCGAHRVGHGTRLHEDESLMDFLNDRRVPVEICITSNVQTRVATYADHPVRRYFDAGLNVVLNTDNRLMSGTTLTDEYAHAATHLGFTPKQLGRMALNGFESAFLPWPERTALLARARPAIESLVGSRL